jgi:hypothetical protein
MAAAENWLWVLLLFQFFWDEEKSSRRVCDRTETSNDRRRIWEAASGHDPL